jgi:predicted DNA-binding transcriptional regulator AlpA
MSAPDVNENADAEQDKKAFRRLMSGAELAQYCGVSKKFISKHTAAGRFPGVVRVGRLLHYDRQIIDRRIAVGKLLLEKQERV